MTTPEPLPPRELRPAPDAGDTERAEWAAEQLRKAQLCQDSFIRQGKMAAPDAARWKRGEKRPATKKTAAPAAKPEPLKKACSRGSRLR